MNNGNTEKKLSEKGEKRLMICLTALIIIFTVIAVAIVSQAFSSFTNTKLMPDAVNNSTARGLEDYSVESNLPKLERYGKTNHGYVPQEVSVSLDDKYSSYITMYYECEVDYYSRPDDENKMNIPDDAIVSAMELTVMSHSFEREEMITYIKDTMKTITDVEVNDTYLRSLMNDSADSLCTCTITDQTHELFDVIYSVELDSFMGYIIDVKVDVSKNW